MRLHDERTLPVWRSMLFVPVNVPKFVEKAHARGADAIILDLEDSVAPGDKEAARTMVEDAARRCAQRGADVCVRVNRPLELVVRDIEAVVSPSIKALLLPKIDSAGHVRLLAELVDTVEARKGMAAGTTKFIVMIETPEGFGRIWEIAEAHRRNIALTLGAEDFALSSGSQPDPDVLLYPKQQVVLAARAAGVMPMGFIGTVADYQDQDRYRDAVKRSRRFGFVGASCIHPANVPVLNEAFSPTQEEVTAARRIVAAYVKAQAEGRGSIEVDGKMIDVPIVERAQRLIDTARRIETKSRLA
ncbi:MAG: CoA ester lyase [Candidatus Rokubacteria bacterium]|nr:CoA ester lyase [Candidatus Rokubacteria bacterium]